MAFMTRLEESGGDARNEDKRRDNEPEGVEAIDQWDLAGQILYKPILANERESGWLAIG